MLEQIAEVQLPFRPARLAATHPDTSRLALSDGVSELSVIDMDGVSWRASTEDPPAALAFLSSDELVVSIGGADTPFDRHELVIRDARDGMVLERLDGLGGPVSAGGGRIALAGPEGAALAVRSGSTWHFHPLLDRPVEVIALSADGARIALADMNASGGAMPDERPTVVRLFAFDGQEVREAGLLEGHGADIASLAFTASGDLVSGDHGGSVRFWRNAAAPGIPVETTLCQTAGPAEESCALDAAGRDDLVAGNFRDTVLVALASGHPVDTTAVIIRQGPARVALARSDLLVWIGRPPTSPAPVARWWQIVQDDATGGVERDRWLSFTPSDRGLPSSFASIDEAVAVLAGDEVGLEDVGYRILAEEGARLLLEITIDNVMDDSIAGLRVAVELEKAATGYHPLWAGEQTRCHEGRGHADWKPAPCL
ncbi:WD40 repeat domain-containing protein [Geminicoccaceae bacterium 1502E]|nr:WD40 repeat domain-containing protein [Geminicoccaceae bacterium 1502E]